MTKINLLKFSCSVCGTKHEYRILCSTNTLGSPDLDLRPPEMQRSTMDMWVQQCPECGFCSTEVSDKIDGAAEIVHSDAYQSLLHDERFPKLARSFLLVALLNDEINPGLAATSRLHAAWVCDDSGLEDIAAYCRQEASDGFAARIPFENTEHGVTEGIVYVDILRRMGEFARARTTIDDLSGYSETQDVFLRLLNYQRTLCDQEDDSCKTVADAVKE